MADPLFFFGAGASAVFGIPTMKEMVALFKNELFKSSDAEGAKEYKLYTDIELILTQKVGYGTVDLEAVFTVIDGIARGVTPKELGFLPAFHIGRSTDLSLLDPPSQEFQETARGLRTKFEDFVKRSCRVDPKKLEQIVGVYLAFFDAVGRPDLANLNVSYQGRAYHANNQWQMFTTNYDNVLEFFWRDGIEQLELNTGFYHESRTQRQVMNPQLFIQGGRPALVKLHGSITWWVEEGTGIIVEIGQPPSPEYVPRKFKGQLLLYPIQQKATFLEPYIDMFYALKQALNTTQRWLVVGYSFADDVIRAMFANASRPNKRLILVHPDSTIGSKVQNEPGWQGQLHHIASKFGESQTNVDVTNALRMR